MISSIGRVGKRLSCASTDRIVAGSVAAASATATANRGNIRMGQTPLGRRYCYRRVDRDVRSYNDQQPLLAPPSDALLARHQYSHRGSRLTVHLAFEQRDGRIGARIDDAVDDRRDVGLPRLFERSFEVARLLDSNAVAAAR